MNLLSENMARNGRGSLENRRQSEIVWPDRTRKHAPEQLQRKQRSVVVRTAGDKSGPGDDRRGGVNAVREEGRGGSVELRVEVNEVVGEEGGNEVERGEEFEDHGMSCPAESERTG